MSNHITDRSTTNSSLTATKVSPYLSKFPDKLNEDETSFGPPANVSPLQQDTSFSTFEVLQLSSYPSYCSSDDDDDEVYDNSCVIFNDDSTEEDSNLPQRNEDCRLEAKEVINSNTIGVTAPRLSSWTQHDDTPFSIVDGLSTKSLFQRDILSNELDLNYTLNTPSNTGLEEGITLHDLLNISESDDSVGAVSYTHLDVYKRQLIQATTFQDCLRIFISSFL